MNSSITGFAQWPRHKGSYNNTRPGLSKRKQSQTNYIFILVLAEILSHPRSMKSAIALQIPLSGMDKYMKNILTENTAFTAPEP